MFHSIGIAFNLFYDALLFDKADKRIITIILFIPP
jgi:hypothetical protein